MLGLLVVSQLTVCFGTTIFQSHLFLATAADNRLSPAVLDHKWLLTTSHIFTVKWFKMVFHLIDFILICYEKNFHNKGKWPVLLAFLYFWGPVLRIHVDSLVFSCMDTKNVAFKFSPYLLLTVVYELLSNFDFTLPIVFLLIPITLEGCWPSQMTSQQSLSTLSSFHRN